MKTAKCTVLTGENDGATQVPGLHRNNPRWPIRVDFVVTHPSFKRSVYVEIDGIQHFGLAAKSLKETQLFRDCSLDLKAPELLNANSLVRVHQETAEAEVLLRIFSAGQDFDPVWDTLLDALNLGGGALGQHHRTFIDDYNRVMKTLDCPPNSA